MPTFSTTAAAEVADISNHTVLRHFDSGDLKGFKIPGSRFRRIPGSELKQWLDDNGIPTEKLNRLLPGVLVVSPDPTHGEALKAELPERECSVYAETDFFAAGARCIQHNMRMIAVDMGAFSENDLSSLIRLKGWGEQNDVQIFGILSDGTNPAPLKVSECFANQIEASELIKLVEKMLDSEPMLFTKPMVIKALG